MRPLSESGFKNSEIQKKLLPLVLQYNQMLKIYVQLPESEKKDYLLQIQQQFQKIAVHYTCEKGLWTEETHLFDIINEQIRQTAKLFLPPLSIPQTITADKLSEVLKHASHQEMINFLKTCQGSRSAKLNFSFQTLLEKCRIERISIGNRIVLKIQPKNPQSKPFVLTFSIKYNEEILAQRFENNHPEYFPQVYDRQYCFDKESQQTYIIEVMPYLKKGNLQEKLSSAKTEKEIALCLTYIEKMSHFFQKLTDETIFFPDAKTANFMISDKDDLQIVDKKSYLRFISSYCANDYHYCDESHLFYSPSHLPPEFLQNTPINLEKSYSFFVGLALEQLLIPAMLSHPQAGHVLKLIKKCLIDRIPLSDILNCLTNLQQASPHPFNVFQQDFINKKGVEYVLNHQQELEELNEKRISEVEKKYQLLKTLYPSCTMRGYEDILNIEESYELTFMQQQAFFEQLSLDVQQQFHHFYTKNLLNRAQMIEQIKKTLEHGKELSKLGIVQPFSQIEQAYIKKQTELTSSWNSLSGTDTILFQNQSLVEQSNALSNLLEVKYQQIFIALYGEKPLKMPHLNISQLETLHQEMNRLEQQVNTRIQKIVESLDIKIQLSPLSVKDKLNKIYMILFGEPPTLIFSELDLEEKINFLEKECQALNDLFPQPLLAPTYHEFLVQKLTQIQGNFQKQQTSSGILNQLRQRLPTQIEQRSTMFNCIFKPAEQPKALKYFLRLPIAEQNLILASLKRMDELAFWIDEKPIQCMKQRFLKYCIKNGPRSLAPNDLNHLQTINRHLEEMINILITEKIPHRILEKISGLVQKIR